MRRYIFPLIFFCVALVVLFASGAWSLPAGPVPPLGATLGQPTPIPSPDGVDDGPVKVLFVDESVTWDWTNTCEDELAAYVVGAGYGVEHLLVTLSDDDDLTLGVAYPNPEHIEALALGGCSQEGDILACRVSVNAGDPGPALDAATAALLGYSVADYFRDKSETGWAERPAWEWGDYGPLVVVSEAGWTSDCVEVER